MKNPGLLITIICMVLISTAFAQYDYTPRPKATPDLTAFLIPTPKNIIDQHGYSDRTIIMYNLAALNEIRQDQETRIKVLEGQVVELEAMQKNILRDIDGAGIPIADPPYDPNEVEK